MGEECRLRVLEKRPLRRTFGPKRDELTGEWKRLHNNEFKISLKYIWTFSIVLIFIDRNNVSKVES